VRRLDNSRFGFPSNCFVCEPANSHGLRVPFTHDEDASLVFAEFSLGDAFSGAPNYVHGGLILALLDEAMAWATIAIGERFAVTQRMDATFDRPVRVGRPHRVEAFVDGQDETGLDTHAHVLKSDGRRCAEAHARFVILSAAAAEAAIGTVSGDDAKLLGPEPPAR